MYSWILAMKPWLGRTPLTSLICKIRATVEIVQLLDCFTAFHTVKVNDDLFKWALILWFKQAQTFPISKLVQMCIHMYIWTDFKFIPAVDKFLLLVVVLNYGTNWNLLYISSQSVFLYIASYTYVFMGCFLVFSFVKVFRERVSPEQVFVQINNCGSKVALKHM